jgi:hypothetical protein
MARADNTPIRGLGDNGSNNLRSSGVRSTNIESGAADIGAIDQRVSVVGTDISSPSRGPISTKQIEITLSRSGENDPAGYDDDNQAAIAQYRAYSEVYEKTLEGRETEVLGLTFTENNRTYFSSVETVPARFDATINLDGIRAASVTGNTHTHPGNSIFNGLDYVTPSSTGRPFYVRVENGNVYRWEPEGAARYSRYLKNLQRSGSARSHETEIADPERWGITNICPGGVPCVN